MKKGFFVQVVADFLLNAFEDMFPQTPWLYLFLRFKQDYYPNKAKENGMYINTVELAKEFKFSQSTVWRSFEELVRKGIAIRLEPKKYYLLDEKKYINSLKRDHVRIYDTKNAFFQINREFFLFYWQYPKNCELLNLYYYFLMKNNHFMFPKVDKIQLFNNGFTITTLWKELKTHRLTINKQIILLEEMGLLENIDGVLHTVSEDYIIRTKLLDNSDLPPTIDLASNEL